MNRMLLCALPLLVSITSPAQTPGPAADPYRPVYHFTAPKNWINLSLIHI